ncbi:MAG: HD-GYP domain-containing protein [Thermodesulfobacteriota bacterium]
MPVVRHHHEFYDGTGYPDGLKGQDIPLEARILSVADTVDAMASDRPYRKGRPMNIILDELKKCSGHQFDPEVVRVYLDMSERSA